MEHKWNILVDGRELDEDEIIEKIFEARKIKNPEHFFNPTSDDMIDPNALLNIDEAYLTVMKAVDNDWNFVIHADVDCDGCTSAAIMYRYLKNYTNKITVSINKGKTHGVNFEYNLSLIKTKTIVIIVDSINENYDVLYDYITSNNLDVKVLILDHHIIPKDFDSRPILVSSANNYLNPQLSGAGVCLKFCQYIDYNELACYSDELYDLAACGMVADMVDMTVMENRYIVQHGLDNLVNPGIKAVIGNYQFDSTSISYSIAPLVNAACRTCNNELALKLFIEDDVDIVYQIVERLRECKVLQDRVVTEMMPEIIKQNESQINNKVSTFLIEPRADVSVAGLLGNKLCDELQKPVLVLNKNEDILTGSARAVGLESFIEYTRKQDVEFADGHENAHGIGIKKENILAVRVGLEQALKSVEFVDERVIDIELEPFQIDRSLINKLKFYNRVTGENFKPITVCIKGISDATSKPMSNGKHMRMQKDGINYIKWNSKDDLTGKTFDVYGVLDCAYWGRSWNLNLIIENYMEAELT